MARKWSPMVGSPVVEPEYRKDDRLTGGFFMPED